MNKKMLNTILILLIVGLISTMGAANAHPILEPNYEIVSHDVTVKQGETATIIATLNKYFLHLYKKSIKGALLFFTVKDKNGNILATKIATTTWRTFGKSWYYALCKIKTAKMPKGNHTLTIRCLFPEKGVVKPVKTKCKFKVV
jgi:hypothetical protein